MSDRVFALLCSVVAAVAAVAISVVPYPGGVGRLVARSDDDPLSAEATTKTVEPRPSPSPFTGPALEDPAVDPQLDLKRRSRKTAPPAPRARPRIVLAAVRGSSWLAVRRGSAEGIVLFEGVLEQGDSIRFRERRVWVRLGAAAYVDVAVNGRELPTVAGTVDLVLNGR